MSFVVIVDHFGAGKAVTFVRNTIGGWAVPCFMFLSFYLLAPKFKNITQEFVVKRIKRLYLPLLIWTIVTFVLYAFLFQLGLEEVGLNDWRKVFYSLIFGSASGLVPHFWFNVTQIIIFIFAVLILYSNRNKEKSVYVFYVFIIVAFFIQFSGINSFLFDTSPYEVRYTLGRVAETMPFAFSGILASQIKENDRWKSMFLGAIGIAISLFGLTLLFGTEYGNFGYSGTKRYIICTAICLVVVFVNYCPKSCLADVINYIASLSAGIYYMHFTVGLCVAGVLQQIGLSSSSFYCDIIIWIVCIIGTMIIKNMSKHIKWLRFCIE